MAEIVCGTCGTNDGTHERWCAVGRRITEIAAKDRRIAELEAALGRASIDARVLAVRLEKLSNSREITADVGDYFAETSHKARELSTFCAIDQDGTPAIDAALAAAKREALEAAADRARENGKVYSTPLMTEDELRRMAREVK